MLNLLIGILQHLGKYTVFEEIMMPLLNLYGKYYLNRKLETTH